MIETQNALVVHGVVIRAPLLRISSPSCSYWIQLGEDGWEVTTVHQETGFDLVVGRHETYGAAVAALLADRDRRGQWASEPPTPSQIRQWWQSLATSLEPGVARWRRAIDIAESPLP